MLICLDLAGRLQRAGCSKQPQALSAFRLLFHEHQGAEHTSFVLELIELSDSVAFVSFYLKTVCKNWC